MNTIVYIILFANVAGVLFLWTRDKSLLYAIMATSVVVLFGLTAWEDFTPEWKQYQRQYRAMLLADEKDPAKRETIADEFTISIRQLWNKELKVADRCTTCHLGVDNPNMKDAPQPFKFHEAAHFIEGRMIHDFSKIGCTICHQGQGRATFMKEAHAREITHWDFPMFTTGDRDMTQASCPQCHEELSRPESYEILPGAEMIMDARDFAGGQNELEIECINCHLIYGIGEVVAPDLAAFGESTEHEFEETHNMHYVEGKHNKYNWTYEHFLDPKRITPDDPEHGMEETLMPDFEMDEEMAHKLTVWVYSMKESKVPVKYRYNAEEAEKAAKRGRVQAQIAGLYSPEEYDELSEGEKLFLRYNCWVCHTVRGKGGKLGPDLSTVGKRRQDNWMVAHFKDPRSVSQKSFMPQFNLSDEQIDELVVYLKTLK